MSSPPKGLNDKAWEALFEKYDILSQVGRQGRFEISAAQIKEFREPRLMAKFDHVINLPEIFAKNKLAILPITRGDYVIAHFDAYHAFEPASEPIERFTLPAYIQSLDSSNIPSEAVALNCAAASGIIADFLQDEDIAPTVSGRMGSGAFDFRIDNAKTGLYCTIHANNTQLEIDAAYEGVLGLALFEAKRDLSDDFLVRQIYYPFRAWRDRVTKPVRTLFLIYSNGVYHLYEYEFQDPGHYNSLFLIRQKNYSIDDTTIEITDIQDVMRRVCPAREPRIQFPQADSFERVVNICELLNEKDLSRNDVTEQYAFDARQTNYYTDAARYLGLLDKRKDGKTPVYSLSEAGRRILGLNYKKRQLAFCERILSHKAFSDTLTSYFETGRMPPMGAIVQIMKQSDLYNVGSDSTFERRSSTIKGWLNWIIGLVNE